MGSVAARAICTKRWNLRLEWNKYVKIRQGPQVRAGTFVVIVPSGIFGECDAVNKAQLVDGKHALKSLTWILEPTGSLTICYGSIVDVNEISIPVRRALIATHSTFSTGHISRDSGIKVIESHVE